MTPLPLQVLCLLENKSGTFLFLQFQVYKLQLISLYFSAKNLQPDV